MGDKGDNKTTKEKNMIKRRTKTNKNSVKKKEPTTEIKGNLFVY